MIGPAIDGFRTGQRVRIVDPADPAHGRSGYIVSIALYNNQAVFSVDLGVAKKRPSVRVFRAGQIEAVEQRS